MDKGQNILIRELIKKYRGGEKLIPEVMDGKKSKMES